MLQVRLATFDHAESQKSSLVRMKLMGANEHKAGDRLGFLTEGKTKS